MKNKYMTKVSVYGHRCLEVLIFDLNVCLMAAVTPRVAIIMGSDSDLPTMKDAAEILKNFGVPYEVSCITMIKLPLISRHFLEGVFLVLCNKMILLL